MPTQLSIRIHSHRNLSLSAMFPTSFFSHALFRNTLLFFWGNGSLYHWRLGPCNGHFPNIKKKSDIHVHVALLNSFLCFSNVLERSSFASTLPHRNFISHSQSSLSSARFTIYRFDTLWPGVNPCPVSFVFSQIAFIQKLPPWLAVNPESLPERSAVRLWSACPSNDLHRFRFR